MRKGIFLKPLVISVLSAVILCAISVVCLARYSIYSTNQHRQGFLASFADSVEQNIASLTEAQLHNHDQVEGAMRLGRRPGDPHFGEHPHFHDHHRGEPPPGSRPPGPPPDMDGPPPPDMPPNAAPDERGRVEGQFFGEPKPPHLMTPPPPQHMDFWLVTDKGEVVFANNADKPLPIAWDKVEKPAATHQIVNQKRGFFSLRTGSAVIRLDRDPPLYLMVGDFRGPLLGPLLLVQSVMTFATVVTAMFISLTIIFYYLRRKSEEARHVLGAMERGDLNARFEIKRFDEFGGLMVDFNRMAGEIERLVARVHSTEAARNRLLQELGHDLRTPLTSLTTSFENLQFHSEKMSPADRADSFDMIGAELLYLKDLLDKLMTIATLDEPHYRKSAEVISICELLQQELKTRQSTSTLRWQLDCDVVESGDYKILGDRHLVLRLFKNSFDNAARYAKSQVRVHVSLDNGSVLVRVSDDGSGMSEGDLNLFGKRREQRLLRRGDRLDISLGLGSVIMKAIAELHGGKISIANLPGPEFTGAELSVTFPQQQESDTQTEATKEG